MTELRSKSVDIAALRTLKLVYDLRSFTRAATRLDVNQSAISYTIDKLRHIFDDPLFFRQGGRVVPTDRCLGIVEGAQRLLELFDQMTEPESFDPATSAGSVSIACNYYERQVVMPRVLHALRSLAPKLALKLINATHTGPELLRTGDADLLLGPTKPNTSDFYCRTLLDERYVCIMSPENPLAQSLDLESYLSAPHVTVDYGDSWRSPFMQQIDADDRGLNEVISVPSPAGLDQLISGTDLISTIPVRLAQRLTGEIVSVPCPYPAPFEVNMIWTTRTHNAQMFKWLRNLISDVERALPDQIN